MAYDIGPRISIEGEREFNNQIKQINDSLKEYGSELKSLNSEFSKNENSQEALTKKTQVYEKQLDAQRQKLSLLEDQYGKQTQKLKQLTEEYQRLSKENGETSDAAIKAENAMNKQAAAVSKLKTSMNETKNYINELNNSLETIPSKFETFGNKAKSLGEKLAPVSLAAGGVAAASVNLANTFEDSMAQTAGALDIPMSKMGSLKELALQMGKDTIFSAKEAGNAMTELAKGGLTEADIAGGALKATMDLAAASQMDLGTSANVVVQAMGAFGLSANESARAANALAGAAAASSTDVEPLTQGLAQCSAQANNAGWSIEETTAVLARFADAGIEGSDAGTSLKTMLSRLAAPSSEKAADMIDSLGIKTRDSSGELLGASEMAEELQQKLGPLSSAERDAALQTIFGSDAIRAATILMNSGSEGLQKYISATNDQEAAQRMANSQMGEGSKAIEQLKGSLETAGIAIGKALSPVITTLADALTGLLNAFTSLPSGVQTFIAVLIGLVAIAAPLLMIIGQVSLGINALMPIISGILPAIASAGPIILAVIAAITAIIVVIKNWGAISEWLKNLWNTVWTAIKDNPAVKAVTEIVKSLFENLKTTLTTIWNGIKSVASGIWNLIKNVILAPVLLLIDLVTGDFKSLKSDLSNIWENIKNAGKSIWNGFKSIIKGIVDGIVNHIKLLFNPKKAIEWGKDFIQGLIDGIKSMIGKVGEAASWVAEKIRSFLHFSRPDEGPLREYETWMPDFMAGLAKGMYDNIKKVQSAAAAVATSIDSTFTNDVNGIIKGASVSSTSTMVIDGDTIMLDGKAIGKSATKYITTTQAAAMASKGRRV